MQNYFWRVNIILKNGENVVPWLKCKLPNFKENLINNLRSSFHNLMKYVLIELCPRFFTDFSDFLKISEDDMKYKRHKNISSQPLWWDN
jgi:hypothetical protein